MSEVLGVRKALATINDGTLYSLKKQSDFMQQLSRNQNATTAIVPGSAAAMAGLAKWGTEPAAVSTNVGLGSFNPKTIGDAVGSPTTAQKQSIFESIAENRGLFIAGVVVLVFLWLVFRR